VGYFSRSNTFIPDLPRSCPNISRSEITSLSGACQEYILSLSSCEVPSGNPPVELDDNSCHEFLRKLNYAGCVSKYRGDSDFLSNEWRVWVGDRLNILDPVHDQVKLIDSNGTVIDEYTY